MAAVSASLVTVSLSAAASLRVAPSAQRVSVSSFNGLKAVPMLRRRSAGVVRPAAIPRLSIFAAAAKPETLSAVQGVIAHQLGTEVEKIAPEAKFADLGADSLDTVEIIMALEETFKITLDEEGAQQITTVQEAADLIEETISA